MASPAKKSVQLFYDVVSPFSWIAFEVLSRYQQKWPIDVQLKPIFLGGIMQGTGNKPPMTLPAKAKYQFKEIPLLARHFGVPLQYLSNPVETMVVKGTLKTMRFVTAIDMKHPEYTGPLSRELWMRIWNRDQDITTPESLLEAAKAAGISEAVAQDAVSRMTTDDVKNRLKSQTQEIIDAGAFGAPSMLAKDKDGQEHMVFGSDRFNILADILDEQYVGPLKELSKL